jgi:hypothetical protein
MTTRTRKPRTPKAPDSSLYTTRINHVGALLPDTKMMLLEWDLDTDVAANLTHMQAENIFAKASRSRIPEMLATFRERYLDEPETLAALVTLAQEGAPDTTLRPILFALATRPDPLLRDTVTVFLASRPSMAGARDGIRAKALRGYHQPNRNWYQLNEASARIVA